MAPTVSRDRNYFQLVELQKRMSKCAEITAELNRGLLQKSKLEQKSVEKADELDLEDPNNIVTSGVLSTIEQCYNAIDVMNRDRSLIETRLR